MRFGEYSALIDAVIILILGITIFYLQQYEIHLCSKLNKYRIRKNNILIRLKLFKYDWKCNLILIIPYLIAWNIFLVVLILYVLSWSGVVGMTELLNNRMFCRILGLLMLIMMIYMAVIQEIIGRCNDVPDDKKTRKSTKKEETEENKKSHK